MKFGAENICWMISECHMRSVVKSSLALVTDIEQLRAKSMACPVYLRRTSGMPCLSKENIWRLFCRHVFPTNGVPPKELEAVAGEIEGKCTRLPLAIKRAAAPMARRQLLTEWFDAFERLNKMDSLNDMSRVFMLVLEMSYEGLPSHLKLCFPFCSEFPQDYEIECEFLKAFWIGEGIICGGEGTEPYDVAEGCLNELIKQPITSPEMESCLFGGNLLENYLKRVWKDTSERPFRVKIGDKMSKFLIDILKESVKIHWLGVGLSGVGYVLESADQVSANKEQCVKLLRYMDLAKHVRELNEELPDNREKLKDVVDFIVQGCLMCVSQMSSHKLFRLISAPVDAEEIKKIESQLGLKYQDLTMDAVIGLLNRRHFPQHMDKIRMQ